MKYFCEPVNLNMWNLFEKVSGVGHIECFYATNKMNVGDVMFLHVGSQVSKFESGIYAVGEIISKPYILRNSPTDYCNNRNTVDVKIIKYSTNVPLISHIESLKYINQFRSHHMLEQEKGEKLYNLIFDNEEKYKITEIEKKNEINRIDNCKNILTGKEVEAIIKVRVNQGIFRKIMLKKYGHCCLCGISKDNLLIASHIKPWSKSNEKEKLNEYNGLLLCSLHDKLFDLGYISFNDDGTILISSHLNDTDRVLSNINEKKRIIINDENLQFIRYHRNNIFIR